MWNPLAKLEFVAEIMQFFVKISFSIRTIRILRIGEKFFNFMELYNATELCVFRSSKILLNLELYNGS